MKQDPTKFQVLPEDFIFSNKQIRINKSELIKAVNVSAESGEPGFAFVPQVIDQKKRRKIEDNVVTDITTFITDAQKNLEEEIKRLYNL